MTIEANKAVIRRYKEEILNSRDLAALPAGTPEPSTIGEVCTAGGRTIRATTTATANRTTAANKTTPTLRRLARTTRPLCLAGRESVRTATKTAHRDGHDPTPEPRAGDVPIWGR